MNRALSILERWLFGERLTSDGAGLETTVENSWPWPGWMLVLLLAMAAVIVVGVYASERSAVRRWQRILLTLLRIGAIGVLGGMLLGWMVQQHRTDLPDLVLVLDDTQSMNIADLDYSNQQRDAIKRRLRNLHLDEPTRLNLAKTLLLEDGAELLKQLSARYNLKFYLAGSSARTQTSDVAEMREQLRSLTADETSTRLGRTVRDVLEAQRGQPTAAIILFTDGVTTEGKPLSDAAEYARRKAVPLLVVGLGNERPPRDLGLSDLLTDDSAFVGDLMQFEAKLSADGFKGAAKVRLLQDGVSQPLAEQIVTLDPAGGILNIRLTHRPLQKGEFDYTLEVVPQAGEVNAENNRLTKRVQVSDETIRVLLVQAYPSYEFRFLKTLLERELNPNDGDEKEKRGFRTVLQEADLEYVDTDKSADRVFPVSREELFQYDVLIFGDVNPALLSQSVMNNIYEFATVRGGGVIFIAGPRYTPMAYRDTPIEPLLPMELATISVPGSELPIVDEFRPRLTPLGLSSPPLQLADSSAANAQLWQSQLPPLRWFASAPDLRAGVRVLAEHPTATNGSGQPLPIITLQFVGAGKVVFQATDETHRWRFRLGDRYFGRYWMQMIRYLCRSKLLGSSRVAELTTDRAAYQRGEPVQVRVRFLDDRQAPVQDEGVTAVLEQTSGQRKSLTLHRSAANRGTFEGTASNLPDGEFRLWLASPALVGQPPTAAFRVQAPPGELARLQMDMAEIARAAKITAGKSYTFETAGQLLDDLPRGRQVRIESLPPAPIWNAPLLAFLFVALTGSEWMLRKRFGLV